MKGKKAIFIILFVFFSNLLLFSAETSPSFTVNLDGSSRWSLPIRILVLLTFLTLLPTLIIVLTSFVRIVITFHFVKQAMGAGEIPPSQVIIGLSLFLTVYIMSPVFNKMYENAYLPYEKGKINEVEALKRASEPLKHFMLSQTREKDLKLLIILSKTPQPKTREDVKMSILIPAFILSEIKTGFEIGFLIYIPFLIIDIVVASVLVSLGMIFLPPVMVSLPFKVVLFVLADGWNLLVGSIVRSFG